jgi:hypothetical protein
MYFPTPDCKVIALDALTAAASGNMTLTSDTRAIEAVESPIGPETRTGSQLWSHQLDGAALATPMRLLGADGKQYVAIAAGAQSAGLLRTLHNDGSNSPEKIFVFALEY